MISAQRMSCHLWPNSGLSHNASSCWCVQLADKRSHLFYLGEVELRRTNYTVKSVIVWCRRIHIHKQIAQRRKMYGQQRERASENRKKSLSLFRWMGRWNGVCLSVTWCQPSKTLHPVTRRRTALWMPTTSLAPHSCELSLSYPCLLRFLIEYDWVLNQQKLTPFTGCG